MLYLIRKFNCGGNMQKFFLGIGIALMLIGIFGISYTYNHDHRKANTLEEYATLDFQASRDINGDLEGAVLSLWDYRYDKAQFLKRTILFTDGAPWEIPVATKQTQLRWKYENKLFISFPRSALRDLLLAKEVRLKFYYDNGQSIDLPLGQKELVAWQRKLRW